MGARVDQALRSRWVKPLVFALALLPLVGLVAGGLLGGLGANPAERLIRSTGEWALRFLCLVLVLTPLRQLTGWAALARLRRMLGLFCFLYLALHFLSYAWLDMEWVWSDVARDIGKRPFILAGVLAGSVLAVMAASSFNAAVRALGAARWKALHRLVYLAAPVAVLHFYWMRAAKQRLGDVWLYGGILALLLGWRVWRRYRDAPKAQGSKRSMRI